VLRTAGNGARFAARPLAAGGTPTRDWVDALARRPLPPLDLTGCAGLIVVAPHPDDETLGLGAMAAQLAGVGVQVVSVTDGGAADPGAPFDSRARMETVRRDEQRRAAALLRIPRPISLGLPDGRVAEHEDKLTGQLEEMLAAAAPGTWCAATWRGDGHPDHEAVGRAAAAACERAGVVLLEYPVWMWHWARPFDSAVPWERAHSVPVTRSAMTRKHRAAQCFRSQFEAGADGAEPILPSFVLPRLLAVGEVVFR
jgi:LmbE family N-acetylglucosaminyl deacetylase